MKQVVYLNSFNLFTCFLVASKLEFCAGASPEDAIITPFEGFFKALVSNEDGQSVLSAVNLGGFWLGICAVQNSKDKEMFQRIPLSPTFPKKCCYCSMFMSYLTFIVSFFC